MFLTLEKEAEEEKLKGLCDYISRTCINSVILAPHCWTVCLNPVHTTTTARAIMEESIKSQLSLYLFISLLHNESQTLKE
jgi:hypothetical protein